MKKLKFILPFAIVLAMVLGMGIVSADAVYFEEGEFADNVDVELYSDTAAGPYFKVFREWDGITAQKNTEKYICCHVTDKNTGEKLWRGEDYTIIVEYHDPESGYWYKVDKVGGPGEYYLKFRYYGDKNFERGFIVKKFTVIPYTVKASAISINDGNGKLPMKYTGKIRKFTPSSINIGPFSNCGTGDYEITSKTYTNATKVGTATAKYTFKFKNGFKGTVTKTFKYRIVPKDVKLKKYYKTKNTITARWYKHSTQTTGFRIKVYRLTGQDDEDEEGGEGGTSWKKVKTIYVKSNTAAAKKITSLKRNTHYMINVQAYKTVNGKKYYSEVASKQITTRK